MLSRGSVLTALIVLLGTVVVHAAPIRYDDVLYLDESKEPALHLKALRRTPIASARDSQGATAYLAEGQVVEVIGLGENQHYVSARIATGTARGWVDSQAMEAPPAELLTRLHERREQAQARRESIARHEVAVGMTRVEVRASLGKPDRTSRLHTPQIDGEQWFYTTYDYLPFYTPYNDEIGRPRHLVSYRREVSGHKVITFQNDQVVDIADGKREAAPSPPAMVVPPPQPVN